MTWRHACMLLLMAAPISIALGQEPVPPKEESAESLEPAVDTSAPAQASEPAKPDAEPAPPPAKSGARAGKGMDRLELDTTQITGNRELPKVLYIVPWKRSDLGDLLGRPVNSLLDEVLEPVDRDVFKRENRYYRALQPDAAAAVPQPGPAGEPARPE